MADEEIFQQIQSGKYRGLLTTTRGEKVLDSKGTAALLRVISSNHLQSIAKDNRIRDLETRLSSCIEKYNIVETNLDYSNAENKELLKIAGRVAVDRVAHDVKKR